ncbi:PP2C family protein-serine/threonine phosphatase [Larkinella sp.]|uniref:PP2C family protein-serine/threonine phosphatase n=1 Tax=Larkinella sp. TaxID=2034517 RepID=UPI003BAD7775
MPYIQLAGVTDVGQLRTDNQDTFIAELLTSPGWGSNHIALLAVIDGVGGYMGGDRAATIARRCIAEYMAEPKGEIPSMLREAVVFANNQIFEERKADLKLSRMACVLTITIVDSKKQKLYFVHVGDTRLYRYRNETLEKITQDHSFVGIREDADELTEEEAMNHPRRNEILRDVGSDLHQINDIDFFDAGEEDLWPNDILLLCSDGLTDMLNRVQITTTLNRDTPLETKATDLINLANQQGGKDNITVVLAHNRLSVLGQSQDYLKDAVEETQIETPAVENVAKDTFLSKIIISKNLLWIIITFLTIAILLESYFLIFSSNQQIKKTSILISTSDSISILKTQKILPTELNDTLRLGQTLILGDTLWSHKGVKPLLVIPYDTVKNNVAFRIKKGSKILWENIWIQGFKVGALAEPNVTISLRKVRFINVGKRMQIDWPAKDTLGNYIITFAIQADSVTKRSPH